MEKIIIIIFSNKCIIIKIIFLKGSKITIFYKISQLSIVRLWGKIALKLGGGVGREGRKKKILDS